MFSILRTAFVLTILALTQLLLSCARVGPNPSNYPAGAHSSERSPSMMLIARANSAAGHFQAGMAPKDSHPHNLADRRYARPQKPRSVIPVEINHEKFVGLSEYEIRNLLGPNDAVIIASPAKIMEYNFKRCRVMFYLYTNIETNLYTVLHVITKRTGKKSLHDRRCVAMVKAAGSGRTYRSDPIARS